MIQCFTTGMEFYEVSKDLETFDEIVIHFKEHAEVLSSYPVEAIIEVLHEYGRKLSSERSLLRMEGVPFLVLWLKKANLKNVVQLNMRQMAFLDAFTEIEPGKFLKAQPVGVVCHWIASNVPTLAIFSLFLSCLCKNANLLRVPKESMAQVLSLLKPMAKIEVTYMDKQYFGKDLLNTTAVVYFNREERKHHEDMSLLADGRVIWGGEEAVRTITGLPKKLTCRDVVFGPKYSFAVMDRTVCDNEEIEKYLEVFAKDIITFDQQACSSPQVLFIEKGNRGMREISRLMANILEVTVKRYPVGLVDQAAAANIINKRGEYSLSLDKDILYSRGLEWTILMDNDLQLEEPMQNRTLFIKEVDNILEVIPLITSKIQTIGMMTKDTTKAVTFADKATAAGVDRVVNVGYMNFYDSPWDGTFLMSELVRWCVLNMK